MKTLLALLLLPASAALVFAQSPTDTPASGDTPDAAAPAVQPGGFPGIKVVMTPEEFSKAGLDALSPEQLEVINVAVSRHYDRTVAKQVEILTSVQAKAQTEQTAVAVQDAVAQERQKSWLAHVGLPDISGKWKNEEGIKAQCTGWVTGNSFQLDNGQVWAGAEPIRMELAGRAIEIQPRPDGLFTLVVDGKNSTIRVYRVK